MDKKRVVIGLSGGVDSAVAAYLLKKEGYEVIGIMLNLSQNDEVYLLKEGGCCSLSSVLDARKVAELLDIPFYVLNYKDIFKDKVVDYFVKDYMIGNTPNPCIECNKYLKFGYMYQKAKELGIEYIATGHYAKVEYSEKYGRTVIKKADNIAKDQSYVLYNIPKEVVEKVVFPLANMKSKEEIRKLAREHGLEVANKPDSEDICFIPDGDYKRFLEEHSDLKAKEGNIVNLEGEVLGKHQGLYRYTIGQRKGLGIAYSEPLFVIDFEPEKNELVVGTEKEIYQKEMLVNQINLLLHPL